MDAMQNTSPIRAMEADLRRLMGRPAPCPQVVASRADVSGMPTHIINATRQLRRYPDDIADLLDGHVASLRQDPVDEAVVIITAQQLSNLADAIRGDQP